MVCKDPPMPMASGDFAVSIVSYRKYHPLRLRLSGVMNVALDHMITTDESPALERLKG